MNHHGREASCERHFLLRTVLQRHIYIFNAFALPGVRSLRKAKVFASGILERKQISGGDREVKVYSLSFTAQGDEQGTTNDKNSAHSKDASKATVAL